MGTRSRTARFDKMKKIEIVPDQMGGFETYGRRYDVCAATDLVVRFVDPEYDHLRYIDTEHKAINLHWLGNQALSAIVGFGIPETRQRLKMLECEYSEYLDWQSNMNMWQMEREFE